MKRVVVTGIGVVSCLGNNQEEVYQSLINSKSGISFCEEYKEFNLKSHVHGVPNIKIEELLEAGVHFGHNVRRWNPKMEEYIFGVRNNIHIFNVNRIE